MNILFQLFLFINPYLVLQSSSLVVMTMPSQALRWPVSKLRFRQKACNMRRHYFLLSFESCFLNLEKAVS